MGLRGVWAGVAALCASLCRARLFERMCSPSTVVLPVIHRGLYLSDQLIPFKTSGGICHDGMWLVWS